MNKKQQDQFKLHGKHVFIFHLSIFLTTFPIHCRGVDVGYPICERAKDRVQLGRSITGRLIIIHITLITTVLYQSMKTSHSSGWRIRALLL